MKAIDYVDLYRNSKASGNQPAQASWEVFKMMLDEAEQLARQRAHGNTPSDGLMTGVLNEQNMKWRAFVRMVGDDEGLSPEGFYKLCAVIFKDTWGELLRNGFRRV